MSHNDSAAATFGEVVREALTGIDPARVGAGVVGLAGGGALVDPEVRRTFDLAWTAAGVRAPMTVCSDIEVAFSAASPEPDGAVLVVGTGSVVAQVRDHVLVRAVGGHGWLLGDDGSGFWIGRQAARATLRAMESGERLDGLAAAVRDHVDAPDDPAELVRLLMGGPPVALAELSPLVAQAHERGELIALHIHEEARTCVLALWDQYVDLTAASEDQVVVLGGSIMGSTHPVGAGVRATLGERGWTVLDSPDPVLGAVRRALAIERG